MKLPHTEEVPDVLFNAARVSSLMLPDARGRWRLSPFTVTDEDYGRKMLQLQFAEKRGVAREHEMARAVPPGDYICLQRRMTDREMELVFHEQVGETAHDMAAKLATTAAKLLSRAIPPEARWVPVMSDTPAEILEHWHPLNNAEGNVVITGLGLGCLPHALLTLDSVRRIDIFDIDPDVIELTGPYLTMDERVNIWEASAADFDVVKQIATEVGGWDYAWHDIWSHISPRNLKAETAEHGIAYSTLLTGYAPYVRGEQQAWALDQAEMMERLYQEERTAELEFRRKLKSLPLEEAVDLAYDRLLRDRLRGAPWEGPLTEELCLILDPEGGLKDHLRKVLADPKLWEEYSADEVPDDDTPLDSPNAHLETA